MNSAESSAQRPQDEQPEGAVPVLEVENLVVSHAAVPHADDDRTSAIRAVDGVSLGLRQGEVLGLVGASGCGKSTLAHAAARLIPLQSGTVRAFGKDITGWGPARLRALRRRMQIVFQDVDGSLNPQMSARELIEEPLLVHGVGAEERRLRALEIASRVELDVLALGRRPDRFSGGQRQRIALGRALALGPEILICDEPFSSLDVSVQAQMVDLLGEMRAQLDLSVLFITHDLALARHLCDRLVVMHAGRVVETATADRLVRAPQHPQTERLLRAARVLAPSLR